MTVMFHAYRMLSAKDADDLSVPLGLFISKDEPKKEVYCSNINYRIQPFYP